MTLTNIIMAVGIVFIVLSFFMKDRTKKLEKDIEDLSINIYQETNNLKRRVKIVEEELLLDAPIKIPKMNQQPASQVQPMNTSVQQPFSNAKQAYGSASSSAQNTDKPINSILVSQVLALKNQGLSVDEIQKRSALTMEQIIHILRNGGQQ